MISNLMNVKGYCFAKNKHFIDALNCDERTLQRDLNYLEKLGILKRVVKFNAQGEFEERCMTINTNYCHHPPSNDTPPPVTDVTTPPVTDVAYNNNSINNNIKNKIKKIYMPPTLSEVIDYFTAKGYSKESAERAYNFYDAADWHDSNGKPVRNWKQKMISVWFKPENKTNQSGNSPIKNVPFC